MRVETKRGNNKQFNIANLLSYEYIVKLLDL